MSVEITQMDLLRAEASPELGLPLWNFVLQAVQEQAPLGPEIVEWMQGAGAANRIASPWYVDYSEAGGEVEAMANDAWYPGVFTRSFQIFATQTGAAVQQDGYIIVTDRYGREVGRAGLFDRTVLGQARAFVIHMEAYQTQFNAMLGEFLRKRRLPYSGRAIRAPAVLVARTGYLSLPVAFLAVWPVPVPAAGGVIEYEAQNPGQLVVEVYDNQGIQVGRTSRPSSSGVVRASFAVRFARAVNLAHVFFAYDGADGGFAVRRVAMFPPTLP